MKQKQSNYEFKLPIMRLTFINCMQRGLLLLIPLFLCTILFANENQDGEKITLSEKSVALKIVFKKITSQTGIKFVYSNRLIDDEQKVDVSVRNASLEEVMQQLFFGRKFELQRTSPKSVVLIVHEKEKSTSSVVAPSAINNDVAIIDVSGTVSDVAGEKLPGATVLVKGTNKATMTDGEGRFRLAGVLANAKLMVSYTGYEAEEVRLVGQREVSVRLRAGETRLSEVVVAYGTTTQRSNTGAVTVVKGEQIQNLPNRSFDKSLQGLVPGLLITNGTGQPGGGVSNMVLRGISTGSEVTGNSTVRNPLIVMDGIPVTQNTSLEVTGFYTPPASNPLSQLNPSDIESISVLKDAAAISLYGTKAANGVILITTKKGRPGKTTFGLRSQADLSFKPSSKIRMLDQQSYLTLLFESYKNASTTWTDQTIKKDLYTKFPYRVNGTDTSFYPMDNWYDAVYENRAMTFTNELYMSGGNDKSTFYLNLEYTKQHGIVKNTGFDRKSVRFNFDNKPASWVKIGMNTTLSYTGQELSNINAGVTEFGLAEFMSPLNPIRLNDGSLITNYVWGIPQSSSAQVANPVAVQSYNTNKNNSFRGLTQLSAELFFLKYLSFSSNLGVDFMLTENKQKQDPRLRNADFSGNGSITQSDVRRANVINTNILRFRRTFALNHTINTLLGQEAQVVTQKFFGGASRGTDKALPYYDDLLSPGYTLSNLSSSSSRQTLLSQFGQLNYDYRNKYFFSGSMRRDGASVFGDKQKWGTYWSIGAGWAITSESFLRGTKNWLDYLKVRGSIGSAGSSGPVGELVKFTQLNINTFQNMPAFTPTATAGNPYIQWEETFSWDAGVEAKLFGEKISLTADIYNKKTSDLIYGIKIPTYTGYGNVSGNIGDISNKGIELAITALIIRNSEFRWQMHANWSTNQNVLVKSNVPLTASLSGTLANEEGRNFNSFYMREWAGVNTENGKPQWIDSTGKPTSNYNLAKRSFVGKPQPDGFGAVNSTFNYKGLELSIQFYYQYGFQLYDDRLSSRLSDGASTYTNQSILALNRWQKPGDIALNPQRKLGNTDRGNSISTRYLIDGDYIRLQNVKLSYFLPRDLLQRIRLNMASIYIQGNNLGVWTKFDGIDPDNANVGGGLGSPYPISRTYSAGVNIQF